MGVEGLQDASLVLLTCRDDVEPMTGIEPAYSAWEAAPAHLESLASIRNPLQFGLCMQLGEYLWPISADFRRLAT